MKRLLPFSEPIRRRGAAIIEYVIIGVSILIFCVTGILWFGKDLRPQNDPPRRIATEKQKIEETPVPKKDDQRNKDNGMKRQ